MYVQSSELPKAFAVLEKGELEYPDSVELRYAAASVYEEQGLVASALRELNLWSSPAPTIRRLLNALGFRWPITPKSFPRPASDRARPRGCA